MPLRNDLLNPIPGENPAGTSLRYAPIYDKIKEARREDDDVPQGDFKFDRKLADWPLTIKLITDALATQTKDLQLCAWLAEAMLRKEGVAGLREVLDLMRGMLQNFWDGLFPELEDGDAELRAAPLQWVGERLELSVKSAPLTKGRLNWLQYRESRTVGSEAAADTNEKLKARQEAIAEGKLTEELFDKDFDATPKKFYVDLEETFDATIQSVTELSQLCDEKFGDVSPSFRKLQQVLEEVRQAVHILLVRKREKEPDEVAAPAEEAAAEVVEEEAAPAAAAAPGAARKAAPMTEVPRDKDDAIARIVVAARFLREQDEYNPGPYLLLRGLRWGELRASSTLDQNLLAAPPPDIRQGLKKLALAGSWKEVLETAETAMGMDCGRGWLDLQRYVGRACEGMGSYYDAIRAAVISGLKGLLADYPQLPELTMTDDTPTANAETLAWLKEQVTPPPAPLVPEPVYQFEDAPPKAGEPGPMDAFDLAMKAVRSGRGDEAIEMLTREMAQEPSGRGRFNRKVQVAQLCLGTGHEAVALPILQEVAAEIQRRNLEDWESRDVVAHPLSLLYRCLAKSDGAKDERQKLYAWICRLDPLEAMHIGK